MAQEQASDEENPEGWSWWMIVAFCLTALYFVAFALVACHYAGTPPVGFWARLLVLDLDTLGDFLAGLFAPVAFVFLVATVGVQSQELKAQRHELKQTRREFELNRGVLNAQAEEARRAAEYMSLQTEVMKSERRAADEARHDQILQQQIRRFRERFADNLSGFALRVTRVRGEAIHHNVDAPRHISDFVWFLMFWDQLDEITTP